MKYLFILSLLGSMAQAEDKTSWLCTDQATTRSGNTWYACGVATNGTENMARRNAILAAWNEFATLCRVSDDCHDKKNVVSPKRTTCVNLTGPDFNKYRCYQMLEITVEEK